MPRGLAIAMCVAVSAHASVSGAGAGERGASPAITATLTHETFAIDAEGVTHTSRFHERVYRRDGRVWVERVLPAGAPSVTGHDGHDHDHVNLRIAARYVTREGQNGVKVVLVSAPERLLVDIGPESFDSLGLSRRWDASASLVDLSSLEADAGTLPTPRAGTRWYVRSTAQGYVHVLWSDELGLPLIIETGTTDRRSHTRTLVKAERIAPTARMPWDGLAGYARKDFSDLGD
jgi:hypothetical protein